MGVGGGGAGAQTPQNDRIDKTHNPVVVRGRKGGEAIITMSQKRGFSRFVEIDGSGVGNGDDDYHQSLWPTTTTIQKPNKEGKKVWSSKECATNLTHIWYYYYYYDYSALFVLSKRDRFGQ